MEERTKERNEIITIQDLMEMIGGVSITTASRRMREAKAISNRLHLKGKIHIRDWEDYLNRFNKKEDCVPTPISPQSSNR